MSQFFVTLQVNAITLMEGAEYQHALANNLIPVKLMIGTLVADDGALVEEGTIVFTHGGEDGRLLVAEGKLPVYCRKAGVAEAGYIVCCYPQAVDATLKTWRTLGDWNTWTNAYAEKVDGSFCTLDQVQAGEYIRMRVSPIYA